MEDISNILEKTEIKNLLNQVSIIVKNYDKIAEITGEKYNVFNILGVSSDELSHSAIIANLLNSKGSHGQKDLFLKLFIEIIQDKFKNDNFENSENISGFDFAKIIELNDLDKINSKAQREFHTGKVDLENEKGGFIDILVQDNKNRKIIIENKVYAVDQPKQLIRYNNFDKNAPIFYLNLEGESPSIDSKGNLTENKDFFIITYKDEISKWINLCIRETANKPIIRETLNQYLQLISRLTNQSNNHEMSQEISKLILNNPESYDSFVSLYKSANDLKNEMISEISKKIETIVIENKFEIVKIIKPASKYQGVLVEFNNDLLRSNNLSIRFNFEGKSYTNLIFGLYKIEKSKDVNNTFCENFCQNFDNALKTNSYPAYVKYEKYKNWYLTDLKSIYFDDEFLNDFRKNLEIIKNIIS